MYDACAGRARPPAALRFRSCYTGNVFVRRRTLYNDMAIQLRYCSIIPSFALQCLYQDLDSHLACVGEDCGRGGTPRRVRRTLPGGISGLCPVRYFVANVNQDSERLTVLNLESGAAKITRSPIATHYRRPPSAPRAPPSPTPHPLPAALSNTNDGRIKTAVSAPNDH
ncbi:hypothetical protein EVAR_15778_1 [Eumeta japonica]|uniref:Uncharacterized protein n=1 Tax=Eumeta variegata TaxID=151549 RepID=A0A4C1TZL9_EUMVA|nr:hypothetical protein EVAR_15778_1 [Eumeta japonica]